MAAAELLLVARLALGGVMAFTGLNHFLNVDAMTGYADATGLPAPRLAVLGSGGTLVFGGLGVVLGAFPVIAAGAIAAFLLVATPAFHDFWNAPEGDRQDEMNQFLKNVGLLGGALALLALGGQPWSYAVNVGLF